MLNRLSSISGLVAMLAGGLVLGLSLTSAVLSSRAMPGTVRAGEWTVWPKAGAPDADPYSLALHAMRGDIPLAPGEGLALFAFHDQSGQTLSGSCTYDIVGTMPPSRAWTLVVYDTKGQLIVGDRQRHGVTSSEGALLPGRPVATLGPSAEQGNWIRTRTGVPFTLVLRLYETSLSASAQALPPDRLPRVQRRSCAP